MRLFSMQCGFSRVVLLCALALSGCPFSPDGVGDGNSASDEGGSGAGGNDDASDGDAGSRTGHPIGVIPTGGTGGGFAGGGTGGFIGTGGTGGTAGTGGTDPDADLRAITTCGGDEPVDPLTVVEAHIEGSTLFVTVEHGGGCAEHIIGLCHPDDWQLNDPVEVKLTVTHDAMGDSCDALLTTDLTFDLRGMEAQLVNRTGERAGSFELTIGDLVLEHSFDLDADEVDEDFAELDAQLEAANHCETLEECVSVHVAPCGTRYVSANEDVDALQSAVDAWAVEHGFDQVACLALCQCGVLSCTEGKCVTAEDPSCGTEPETETERMVCL